LRQICSPVRAVNSAVCCCRSVDPHSLASREVYCGQICRFLVGGEDRTARSVVEIIIIQELKSYLLEEQWNNERLRHSTLESALTSCCYVTKCD
jgi:hypothetical protein